MRSARGAEPDSFKRRDQFENVRWPNEGYVTEIANPITSDHTLLRQYIPASLLRLLAANRHHELPQRVYELGDVIRDSKNFPERHGRVQK